MPPRRGTRPTIGRLKTFRPVIYAGAVALPVSLIVIAVILLVAAAVALGIRMAVRSHARMNQAWQLVAGELHLTFSPETFTKRAYLAGTIQGIGVEVKSVTESSGKSSNQYTRYRVSYPPLGVGLKMRASGGWQRLTRLLGAQDISTGDAEFDPEVTVKGDDEEAVRRLLTPARRMSVHRLMAEHRGTIVEDSGITWDSSGLETDAERMLTVIRRMVGVAGRLSGADVTHADSAMRVRADGNPAEAAAMLRSGTADLEDHRDHAEAAYAGARYDEAAEALAELERALPADGQVAAWRRRADERRARTALPEASGGTVLTDPGEVAADLFDPDLLTFEATRRFEDRYEGRTVRWRGRVIRSSPYRTDLEFGGGPGIRAVIRVHRLGWNLYGGRDVDAVVALPATAHAVLRDAGEGEVTFEGRLVRADSLMRNLFVAEGRLLD